MNHLKIEVRYIDGRKRWKATLLTERRPSVYGINAADAAFYLCSMLRMSTQSCRMSTQAAKRVVYEVQIPSELVDTLSD